MGIGLWIGPYFPSASDQKLVYRSTTSKTLENFREGSWCCNCLLSWALVCNFLSEWTGGSCTAPQRTGLSIISKKQIGVLVVCRRGPWSVDRSAAFSWNRPDARAQLHNKLNSRKVSGGLLVFLLLCAVMGPGLRINLQFSSGMDHRLVHRSTTNRIPLKSLEAFLVI